MPRRSRRHTGGFVFHVMNRAARRMPLFDSDEDYTAFLRVLAEAQVRVPLRLLCYALMPNHWHLVVWPSRDEEMSAFMARVTGTHVRRWHVQHRTVGTGTLYQGRYKAIPVKDDQHFLTVCRYVERNPVKAQLASRAADWPWSSAAAVSPSVAPRLADWPVPRPVSWHAVVDHDEAPGEFERLRAAIRCSRPFGPARWRKKVAKQLKWRLGLRPPGRPRARGNGS